MAGECYPLWDFESGNMLYAYDTEEEALEVVRVMIREYGPESVRQWGLERGRRGRVATLATGDALVARALAGEVASSPKPAG